MMSSILIYPAVTQGWSRVPSSEMASLAAEATIDVLMVYSNETTNAAGLGLNTQINETIDKANLAYKNSGIFAKLRLVHTAPANYRTSGSLANDLNWLRADPVIANLRNLKGADVVAMFVEGGDSCGRAAAIGATSELAYVVVDRNCAIGQYTLVHEIGHLIGARHDWAADPIEAPDRDAHGLVSWRHDNIWWRTVMAAEVQCQPIGCERILYFSNPNINYDIQPTGFAGVQNNARVHNANVWRLANFRPPPPT